MILTPDQQHALITGLMAWIGGFFLGTRFGIWLKERKKEKTNGL